MKGRRKQQLDPGESELFRDAMRGVRPLDDDRASGSHSMRRPAPLTRPRLPEAPVPVAHPDPEHARRSLPRRTLSQLRRGRLRPERSLDLHGMRVHEAEAAVLAALDAASGAGLRCLLVVHGIGRGQLGGGAIRAAFPSWLETHSAVLAHCPALPRDGGPGASYVLLRVSRAARGRD